MPEKLLYASLALTLVPIAGILVWFFKKLADKTTRQTPEANILDVAVKEYVLRLQVENRQLRELLSQREKDWEKKA